MSLYRIVSPGLFAAFALVLIGSVIFAGFGGAAEAAPAGAPPAQTAEATPAPADTPAPEPAGEGADEISAAETPGAESGSPMYIESLRARDYPASEIIIEETLEAGSNYQRFIASYMSDGHKIYGLLTVPDAGAAEGGFPTIVVLHGYIRPQAYSTTANYVSSQDGLARSGFVTFKPDFRGHGRSEGIATGAHFSEAYIVDTLNAISALEDYENTDPGRIGLWGHSNGGEIGLRVMVVTDKVRAAVFWGGVVGSYVDMLETYISRISFLQRLAPKEIEAHGTPSGNPGYWNRLDPYSYLDSISAPIQLHHGTGDSSVPVELSISLESALREAGKTVELYQYEGADHNLSGASFGTAMQRSVEFFEKHLEP